MGTSALIATYDRKPQMVYGSRCFGDAYPEDLFPILRSEFNRFPSARKLSKMRDFPGMEYYPETFDDGEEHIELPLNRFLAKKPAEFDYYFLYDGGWKWFPSFVSLKAYLISGKFTVIDDICSRLLDDFQEAFGKNPKLSDYEPEDSEYQYLMALNTPEDFRKQFKDMLSDMGSFENWDFDSQLDYFYWDFVNAHFAEVADIFRYDLLKKIYRKDKRPV